LFVQTEFLASPPALLCTRRARSDTDHPPWLFHLLVGHGGLNRALLGLFDGLPLEEIGARRIQNVEWRAIVVPEGGFLALLHALPTPSASLGP
jgi:broad specificity phosphatase PhoE